MVGNSFQRTVKEDEAKEAQGNGHASTKADGMARPVLERSTPCCCCCCCCRRRMRLRRRCVVADGSHVRYAGQQGRLLRRVAGHGARLSIYVAISLCPIYSIRLPLSSKETTCETSWSLVRFFFFNFHACRVGVFCFLFFPTMVCSFTELHNAGGD